MRKVMVPPGMVRRGGKDAGSKDDHATRKRGRKHRGRGK
jgi:hypothetical protein